jgi:hypothetical protein
MDKIKLANVWLAVGKSGLTHQNLHNRVSTLRSTMHGQKC